MFKILVNVKKKDLKHQCSIVLKIAAYVSFEEQTQCLDNEVYI